MSQNAEDFGLLGHFYYEVLIEMKWTKMIVIIILGTMLCVGCESKEPLYMHLSNPDTELTVEEYKYYIITKAIDDKRNKEWFNTKPTKVIGKEKASLSQLIDSFLDDRYNWHAEMDAKTFGDSDRIYTQRFIHEMQTYDLNKYIPYIVNKYELTSIINYASIMPQDYVQKKVENNQNTYRVYVEIILNLKSFSEDEFSENDIYIEGSNAISFWIFVTEEEDELKINGWYEMIQGTQGNLIIPYWSESDAKDDAI